LTIPQRAASRLKNQGGTAAEAGFATVAHHGRTSATPVRERIMPQVFTLVVLVQQAPRKHFASLFEVRRRFERDMVRGIERFASHFAGYEGQ
jgi:hypothetical protein